MAVLCKKRLEMGPTVGDRPLTQTDAVQGRRSPRGCHGPDPPAKRRQQQREDPLAGESWMGAGDDTAGFTQPPAWRELPE